ncbi:MAG: aromatic acid/H+ symport family MFS transporter [Burkholderia sp.]|jgi:AAHS family benzoate transporter-like MFS transporter|uniref:MFS transporter n=1 Tax=Burkholderia sp. TaxID=36773 RepID=UPI0025892EE1|nr:aromatic acid/H+ symport family MFS transporter [Burkholderia sp.]MCA3778159.1 aromatic acid/H+ symport family MFS transporter [Burkholderia sp.]MCA3783428.1 aromatic acid/H+ symport family MFS transporter [Burkholderia sp.]MCA3809519.1 aromatic acid/H+ symport family MFS transporter [Burkholderia sp.]MCA3824824.1 aromatic acid/H+ symport family MFS transporter [Burkholderia sp.]MCA3829528.1 aromatic acid/H+ symport family MFS transporter [Burkholderia sp.]
MNTSTSKNAEFTRDRTGSTIVDPGDTAGIDIPARVTIRIVAICLAMILAEGYDVSIYGTVLPMLTHGTDWSLSQFQLGAIASCSLAGMMIGAMGAGTLSDIIGRRRMLLGSVTLFSAMMAAAALAPTPMWFVVARVVGGLGLGGVVPTAAALTIEYSPPGRRSFNYALIYTGYSLGGILVALLAMNWLQLYGWRLLFGLGAAPLLIVLLAARHVPESLDFLLARDQVGDAQVLAAALGIHHPSLDVPEVRRDDELTQHLRATVSRERATPVRSLFEASALRATLAFWVAMFMGLLLLYGLSTWLPQLMRKSGFALGSSLGLLVMLNATAALGSLAGGAVADRLGSRPVVSVLYLLAAASLCMLPFAHGMVQTYVLVGIAGVGTIGNTMLLGAFITRYYVPHNRATGIGWALGIGRFGAIAGPLIGGWLAQSGAPLPWNFYAFAGAGLTAAVAVLAVPKTNSSIKR